MNKQRRVKMRRPGQFKFLKHCIILSALLGWSLFAGAHVSLPMRGYVFDTNGQPLAETSVSVTTSDDHGADVVTVFTDDRGAFAMPAPVAVMSFERPPVTARKPGYEQVDRTVEFTENFEAVIVTLTVQPTSNLAAVAPASAWLANMDKDKRATLIKNCAGCHQIPSTSVRNYARLISESAAGNENLDSNQVRLQSWDMIQKYMNSLQAGDIFRSIPEQTSSPARLFEIRNLPVQHLDSGISGILAGYFTGSMDRIESYDYGAPLLATPQTAIREYKTPPPNTSREALLLGTPPRLWLADGGAGDTVIAIELETGEPLMYEVPKKAHVSMAPHTLQRGAGGALWVTPFLNSIAGLFDPDQEEWITAWDLGEKTGGPISINNLSIGPDNSVLADRRGRIWFSNGISGSLGYFSPETGEAEVLPIPGATQMPSIPDTMRSALLMGSDGRHVWYGRPDIGAVVKVDTDTREFETVLSPGTDTGLGRIAMSKEGVLYAPLFAAGQLLVYDTRTGEQKTFDLPDRASAPQAAVFDHLRNVVWIATSNGDLIYRFDPRAGEFAVLPLPRQAAYLRTVAIDPVSGMLVASYADVVAKLEGPGMILTIDPGDEVSRARAATQVKDTKDAE